MTAQLTSGTTIREVDPFYVAVIDAVKWWIPALKLTMTDCDDRAGLQDGYTAHLLHPHGPNGRSGWQMLGLLVAALAREAAKQSPQWAQGYEIRFEPRSLDVMGLDACRQAPADEKRSMAASIVSRRDLRRQLMAELARHGGRTRNKVLSADRRREIARSAAAARWRRITRQGSRRTNVRE
jgi:hypothetical protein